MNRLRVISLLLVAGCHTAFAVEGKANELGFNLFTDLAPLLALFGEQFARQFMSESLLWLDHVVFAMVPLGILTAVIGAIRVSGPSWARAFIGRARESRSSAELQLMSSTSKDVCEVYNGKAIVRSTGQPMITQLLLFPGVDWDNDRTCGLHTLESAYNNKPPLLEMQKFGLKVQEQPHDSPEVAPPERAQRPAKDGTTYQLRRRHKPNGLSGTDLENGDSSSSIAEMPPAFPAELKYSAPNLQLNLPATVLDYSRSIQELWYAAAAAVIVQTAVIVIGGVTSYNYAIRQSLGGELRKYGFPMFSSGTLCLNIGMMLCSWVIERSTKEYSWRPIRNTSNSVCSTSVGEIQMNLDGNGNAKGAFKSHRSTDQESSIHIFWLQRKHTISDQAVGSYLILGGLKKEVITSTPYEDEIQQKKSMTKTNWERTVSNRHEFRAMCGALLGVVGFILQFEGLRGLSWPTAVAQVASILFMALLRAYLRRRLGDQPSTLSAEEGHELDWLALRLVYEDYPLKPCSSTEIAGNSQSSFKWRIVTASLQPDSRLLAKEGEMLRRGGVDLEKDAPKSEINAKAASSQEEERQKHVETLFPRNSPMVLRVRQRLGELVRCPSVASKEAVALSQAIAIVLNEVYPVSKDDSRNFEWHMVAKITMDNPGSQDAANPRHESADDHIMLQAHGDHDLGWRVYSPDIDAILSLWMASYVGESTSASTRDDQPSLDWLINKESGALRYHMILGMNPGLSRQVHKFGTIPADYEEGRNMNSEDATHDYQLAGEIPESNTLTSIDIEQIVDTVSDSTRTGILTRDLDLWTDDPRVAELVKSNHDPQGKRIETATTSSDKPTFAETTLTSGFHGIQSLADADSLISIESNAPLATILSQHMFSAFMWALSGSIPADAFLQTTLVEAQRSRTSDSKDAVTFPKLRNTRMSKIAHDIEGTGLSSAEDILLFMIPPLSYQRLLPNQAMLEPLLEAAKRSELNRDWRRAAEIYGALLELRLDSLSKDRLAFEIVVEVLEFLFMTHEAVTDREGTQPLGKKRLNSSAQALTVSVQSIISILNRGSLFLGVVKDLEWFYVQQRRHHHLLSIFPNLRERPLGDQGISPNAGPSPTLTQEVRNHAGFPQWYYEPWTSEKPQQWHPSRKRRERMYNASDIFGWTPLHYIAAGRVIADDLGSIDQFWDLMEFWPSHHELRDKSGRTPLHYAAAHSTILLMELMRRNIVSRSALNDRARDGSTPIHYAARYGNLKSIDILKHRIPDSLQLKDSFGRSIFHIAAISNSIQILDSCTEGGNTLPASADELCARTPLHLALVHDCDLAALKMITENLRLDVLNQVDSEGITTLDLMLEKVKPRALETVISNFPDVAWGEDLPDQKTTMTEEPAKCFKKIMYAALRSHHKEATTLIFQTIINRSWPESLLLEVFRSFHVKGQFTFLPHALHILDQCISKAVRKSNDRSDLPEDTGSINTVANINQDQAAVRFKDSKSASMNIGEKVKCDMAVRSGAEFLSWVMLNERDDLVGLLTELRTAGGKSKDVKSLDWNKPYRHGKSPLINLVRAGSAEDDDNAEKNAEKRRKLFDFLRSTWPLDQQEEILNQYDKYFETKPIISAARNGLTSLVQSLVEAGADMRVVDAHGRSAFSYALSHQHNAVADILVLYDPDIVNAEIGIEGSRSTPLMQAVVDKEHGVLNSLLKYDRVDPRVAGSGGITPLDWCRMNHNPEVEKRLMELIPRLDIEEGKKDDGSAQQLTTVIEPTRDSLPNMLSMKHLLERTYDLYGACETVPEEIRGAGEHVHSMSIVLGATKSQIILNPDSFLYSNMGQNLTHALRLRLSQCASGLNKLERLQQRFREFPQRDVGLWDRFKWSSEGKREIVQCKVEVILATISLDILLSHEGPSELWTVESRVEKIIKRFNILGALQPSVSPPRRPIDIRRSVATRVHLGRVLVVALVIAHFKRVLQSYRAERQGTQTNSRPIVPSRSKARLPANTTKEGRGAKTGDALTRNTPMSDETNDKFHKLPCPIRRSSSLQKLMGRINELDSLASKQSQLASHLQCWEVSLVSGATGPRTAWHFELHQRSQAQLKKIAMIFREASIYQGPALDDKDSRVQALLEARNRESEKQKDIRRWFFVAGHTIERDPGQTGMVFSEKAIIIVLRRHEDDKQSNAQQDL